MGSPGNVGKEGRSGERLKCRYISFSIWRWEERICIYFFPIPNINIFIQGKPLGFTVFMVPFNIMMLWKPILSLLFLHPEAMGV